MWRRPLAKLTIGSFLAGAVAFMVSGCGDATQPPPSTPPPPAPEPDTAAAAVVQAPSMPAAAPAPPAAGSSINVKAHIHDSLPEMTFTLVADAPPRDTGVLRVRALEVRRGTDTAPAQRIDGLSTDTPWAADAPGLEVLDMNFDGYADLRLIESRPVGPNVPYLNWLYEPSTGHFVSSTALNELSSPQFDRTRREVTSSWRDSATRYGTEVYAFKDGQLVPLRREARDYKRPGTYTLQVSRWIDGAWKMVEKREGRDP